MGGGSYSQDVAQNFHADTSAFAFDSHVPTAEAAARRTVHQALNPFGKTREVNDQTPIVVALDVTTAATTPR